MYKWFFVLLSAVFLSGCTLFFPAEKELSSAQPESVDAPQQENDRYLDDFLAGGDLHALDLFLTVTPDSKQQKTMIRLVQELKLCRSEHDDLMAKLESESRNVADLEGMNQQLRETIEQLKGLLIQLEQRAH